MTRGAKITNPLVIQSVSSRDDHRHRHRHRHPKNCSMGKKQRALSEMKAISLMDIVMDKLNLLGYEQQFCQRRVPPWPSLHRFYFVFSSNNQNEQFRYFTSLVVWLFKSIGHDFPTSNELEDSNATCANLLSQLSELGFSPPSWPPSNLKEGYGDAVCSVLDGLATLALETQNIDLHVPKFKNDILLKVKLNDVPNIEEGYIDEEDIEASNTKDERDEVIYESNAAIVVDAKNWKPELEHVAPQLRASIVVDGKDWRARLEHAFQLYGEISERLENNNEQLQSVESTISFALEKISCREKFINIQIEPLVSDYSATKARLSEVQQKQEKSLKNIATLKEEITSTAYQLEKVKKLMLEKGNMISDVSPLVQIKQALSNLKEELREMEVQIGVLQHTLLQIALKKAQNQGHQPVLQSICLSR